MNFEAPVDQQMTDRRYFALEITESDDAISSMASSSAGSPAADQGRRVNKIASYRNSSEDENQLFFASAHSPASKTRPAGRAIENDENYGKRVSAGSSLKLLFNKIDINDTTHNSNKENMSQVQLSEGRLSSPSKRLLKQSNTKVTNSKFRAPLRPLSNQSILPRDERIKDFGLFNSKGSHGSNSKNLNNDRSAGSHAHSPSMNSVNSFASNASSSKWKFWKNDNLLSRSLSSRSMNEQAQNFPQPKPIGHLRKKSSISSFHNSIFGGSSHAENKRDSGFIMPDHQNTKELNHKHSGSTLSFRSLKHKTSHSSLNKLKIRRKGDIQESNRQVRSACQISLPVPDQVSKHKMQLKLKNSTSLASLSSEVTPINTLDYNDSILQQILQLCDVKYILHDLFEAQSLNLFMLNTESVQLSQNFWQTYHSDTQTTVICKKVSLGSLNDLTTSNLISLHELKSLRLLQGTSGMVHLLQAYIMPSDQSRCDQGLDLYLFFKHHGTPLSRCSGIDYRQALSVFWQCASILYVAESKFEFEHRNLTVDHILMDSKGNVTLIDLKCCRYLSRDINKAFYTRLDHPFFFQGQGDIQFEIYELMRSLLSQPTCWSTFEPRTNLLWLYYLTINLLKMAKKGMSTHASNHEESILIKLAHLLDPARKQSKKIFKKKEHSINTCGDLLSMKQDIIQ
ncbi:YBL009W [Saccharomyces arboricola H-6]|uniref:non-specific serine/threonine protein kinase n=1 Tax=Saccharomyces arboricola (strain H-6 / AS 2.3317 / CBS 10644) TaxID=1160507 RepID=J8PR42_SACAR|nr:YBL009W [Saccharomyces arboricola H-6]